VYIVVLLILLGYLVFALWPRVRNIPEGTVTLFGYDFSVSAEIRLILLVMVVGALGNYINTATSFPDYVGN
jgi:hypothetical protein